MQHAQISFEDTQYEFLVRETNNLEMSLSELIGRLVAERMAAQPQEDDPLERLAGMAEGSGENIGRNHDHYLYGWPKECLAPSSIRALGVPSSTGPSETTPRY